MYHKNIRPFITHCILDSARMGGELRESRRKSLQAVSLYRGMEEERHADIAPYLIPYKDNPEFEKWIFTEGWGKSWGIFFSSGASPEEIRKHFRRFLLVKDEEGRTLYFRFYDPRVLRVFLPTCSEEQLEQLFGPLEFYVCEDRDPSRALVYSVSAGQLNTNMIDLSHEVKDQMHKETIRRDTRDVIV